MKIFTQINFNPKGKALKKEATQNKPVLCLLFLDTGKRKLDAKKGKQ